MSEQKTKTCKMCKSEIHADAKKCPRCCHFQGWFPRVISSPAAVIPMGLLIPLFILLLLSTLVRPFSPGVDFWEHKDLISISGAKLEFVEEKCKKEILISGLIENQSGITWESPRFEIIFFTKDGEMLDTAQDKLYEFLIPKKASVPFGITVPRLFEESQYAAHEVRILKAAEEGHIFP